VTHEDRLRLMHEGERFFLAQVASLDDASLGGPSALPGWTRAHVVGHVARNADALGNLLEWARTGVETPMYPSPEHRAAGIESSAAQPPAALRVDVANASARLVDATASLPDQAWDAPVRTARGRPITAAEVPWMRIRETWVHGVDLDAGASFLDVPEPVISDLLDEVTSGLAGRDDCPPMVVLDSESSRRWRVGPDDEADEPVEVAGPSADLLAWLIGRAPGTGLATSSGVGKPPTPPPWL
jgi:maleylpyruvate isomerase